MSNAMMLERGYYGYKYKNVTKVSNRHFWYDFRPAQYEIGVAEILNFIQQRGTYNGGIFTFDQLSEYLPLLSHDFQCVVSVDESHEIEKHSDFLTKKIFKNNIIILSQNFDLLDQLDFSCLKALKVHVVDNETLLKAIAMGKNYDYLILSFSDPTNIPLELVIASFQNSRTHLIKEINEKIVGDSIVSLGVMEQGADGVIYSPRDFDKIIIFLQAIAEKEKKTLPLEVCTVKKTESIGMGYRGCVDLVTLFSTTEGMLVGSTSQGGILCCAEVFELPYMELRPFRVNAGGVHSYVYNADNTTSYMSELKAGSEVSVVSLNGEVRQVPVGRVKIENRPLRLIEVEFTEGQIANIILQDDWHVRVFSCEGNPFNITEIKPGDRLLGHVSSPGRHVGIKIDENIIET